MDGPIISCDISKESSYIQAFDGVNNPLSKSVKINHDNEGYLALKKLKESVVSKTSIVPYFVFEATGVYQINICEMAKRIGMKLYSISPLESAKVRKSFIRTTKTDKIDPSNIAQVFYKRNLFEFDAEYINNELYVKTRYYETLIKKRANAKNTVAKYANIVFPSFEKYFSSFYSQSAIYVIKHYKCIQNIKKQSIGSIEKTLKNKTCHRGSNAHAFAIKLKEYASKYDLCASSNKAYMDALYDAIDKVEKFDASIKRLADEIIAIASKLENFDLYLSIPGVSKLIAASFCAEFGNLSRFSTAKKLIAYCGVDPNTQQSGNISGNHLQITKKGNKTIRRLLYLVVCCNLRMGKDNKIYRFFSKRKSSGLCFKAAAIATCRKLLTCIYGMITSKTSFKAN